MAASIGVTPMFVSVITKLHVDAGHSLPGLDHPLPGVGDG